MACSANIVQQGQDGDRNILLTGLDVFKVIGQLQHCTQQDFKRLLIVLRLVCDITTQRAHFFGQDGGAVLFDHAEYTLQIAQPLLYRGQHRCIFIFDVSIQFAPDGGQAFIDRPFDPAQGALFNGCLFKIHNQPLLVF